MTSRRAWALLAFGWLVAGLASPAEADGGGAPVYHWVEPPEVLALGNREPPVFEAEYPLTANGSQALSAATFDRQATFALPAGAVPARPPDTAFRLTITPLDPTSVGPPPPGAGYDGNAYRLSALYLPSGTPAPLSSRCNRLAAPGGDPGCLTVVLKYPLGPVLGAGATALYHRSPGPGARWIRRPAQDQPPILQVFGAAPADGIFVAAGPNRPPTGTSSAGRSWLPAGVAGACLITGTVGRKAVRQRRNTSHSPNIRLYR